MRCLASVVVVSICHMLAGQAISSAGLQGSALRQNAPTKPAALAGAQRCLLSLSISTIVFCYLKLLQLCQGIKCPSKSSTSEAFL